MVSHHYNHPHYKTKHIILTIVFAVVLLGSTTLYLLLSTAPGNEHINKNATTTTPTLSPNSYVPSEVEEVATIFAIGGFYKDKATGATPTTNTAEYYSFETDTWQSMPPMRQTRGAAAVAAFGNKIYVFGGQEGNLYAGTKTVEAFDPMTNEWTMKANMPSPRFYSQAIAANNRIYLLGGIVNGSSDSKVIDIYNPANDTWETPITFETQAKVYTHACAAMASKIYCPALGDYTYTLVFDTIKKTWISIPTQNRVNNYMPWVAKDYLMYAPSFTGEENEIITFDSRTDAIQKMSAGNLIHNSYQGFGTLIVGDYMYLIGGQFSGDPVTDVYINVFFKPADWKKITPLNSPRSSASVVVLPVYYKGTRIDPAETGTISGVITKNGIPAADVKIMLSTGVSFLDDTYTRTDQSGKYSFVSLKPGKYQLGVEMEPNTNGFAVPSYNSKQEVDLEAGESITDYNYDFSNPR